jgi:DNA-binding MarR family transcriptional regulator
MSEGDAETRDHVDWILEAWAREMPYADASAMAVVGRLLRASRHLERGIERQLATFGLNITEFNILAALRRAGAPHRLAPVDLSRSLLLTSGGLTKRIDRLELEGLIERTPDPEDRRSVLVGLTPTGLEMIDEAVTVHFQNEARLIQPLSSEQRDSLSNALRTLLASFDDTPRPKRRRETARSPAADRT